MFCYTLPHGQSVTAKGIEMLELIVLLIVVGIALSMIPMDNTIRRLIIGIVCIFVILWLFRGHSLSLR